MRGRVLTFNPADGTGLISGGDGQRYQFANAGLPAGPAGVMPGVEVDFQVENGAAVGIYVVPLPAGEKNRIVAALLALFLGHWGVHKFYLGKTNAGIIMLVCGTVGWLLLLPGLVNMLIAFIEFIIYLVKSDQEFYRDYVVGDRSWL
ncbi:MAG: TM2 domain-containing protein [Caulobacteraceae bacterium]|nr:TM2 domain-containing protein [Caulobacteraceae bacterium]